MSRTFTLAHLSDVHLGPLPPFALRHWNAKRVLGYLNWQRGRRHVHTLDAIDRITSDLAAHAPDHIAVTGDLVNIALPGEYEAARAWLERLGPPDKVSVVPGNHDIYTRLNRDPGCGRWADYMQSDPDRASSWTVQGALFPYVRRRGSLAIIGVNSAVPTPPFVAAGMVGTAQLSRLRRLLDRLAAEGAFRVVLIHHPPLAGQAPPLRALRDADVLERVLTDHGAELVLHGHNHRDMLAWRQWKAGRFPVVGIATGSAARPHRDEPMARYNLIEVAEDDAGFVVRARTRGLAPSGDHVIELTAALLEHRVAKTRRVA